MSPVWRRGVGLVILALLFPGSAMPQGRADVQAYLLSVKRLYEDFENESALKQIASAKKLALTKGEEVTLSLYEGVIQADLNRWEASAAAFKKALSLHPEARLPVKVSPKVEQHFEKVRVEVKKELAARAKPPEPPRPAPPPTDRPLMDTKPDPGVIAKRPPTEPEPPPVSPSGPEGAVTQAPPAASRRSFMRPEILGPAIGGGILLVLGGTSWGMSRRELSRLNNDDSALATPEDVRGAASRGRTLQSIGVGMLGAGVAGLGFALGWYAFGSSSEETALRVGTDGSSAFVQGRWP